MTLTDAFAILQRRRDFLRDQVQNEYRGKDYDLAEIGALDVALDLIGRAIRATQPAKPYSPFRRSARRDQAVRIGEGF